MIKALANEDVPAPRKAEKRTRLGEVVGNGFGQRFDRVAFGADGRMNAVLFKSRSRNGADDGGFGALEYPALLPRGKMPHEAVHRGRGCESHAASISPAKRRFLTSAAKRRGLSVR